MGLTLFQLYFGHFYQIMFKGIDDYSHHIFGADFFLDLFAVIFHRTGPKVQFRCDLFTCTLLADSFNDKKFLR